MERVRASDGEDRVEDVAAHVAEGAGAEVEPLPPLAGVIVAGDERPLRRHAEPAVPVQLGRAPGRCGRAVGSAIAPVLAAPAMDLLHLADGAAWIVATTIRWTSCEWIWMPIWVTSFFSLRRPGQLAGLVDRLGQRLLGVDVQPLLHRPHGDRGVHVVRRRDVDRVEVLLLVEQLAPVLVDPDVGELAS